MPRTDFDAIESFGCKRKRINKDTTKQILINNSLHLSSKDILSRLCKTFIILSCFIVIQNVPLDLVIYSTQKTFVTLQSIGTNLLFVQSAI